jgi:lysophospholipase L1-like esterase
MRPGLLGAAAGFVIGAVVAGLIASALPGRAAPSGDMASRSSLITHHLRLDGNVPSGALLFFGSSSIQGLAVGELAGRAVNFGIGGETIPQLMERLPRYRSLSEARGIVLAIGYNDLVRLPSEAALERYAALLELLPSATPLVLSGVQPGRREPARQRAASFNSGVAALCAARPGCVFVDLAAALEAKAGGELYEADGIHLSAAGYSIWKQRIADALGRAGVER